MMPLRRFQIHQPKTVKEAAEMLSHYGENGRLYAGGTELLLAMKHNLLRYEHLVDVKELPGLNTIETRNNSLRIGTTVTHRAIEKSAAVRDIVPVLADMAHHVANVRVRATGTLGGNLCFAEPHSDPATLLVALGAKAHVQGKSGTRSVTIDKLITGAYETVLANDELLAGSKSQVERQLGDAAEALAQAAEPVDDLEGSAEYKRHLIGVFLKRAFIKALA